MFVVMQHVMCCDMMGDRCQLSWHARGTNEEADNITKNRLDGFDGCLRIPVTWAEIDFSVLEPLLAFCDFREDL